jgi:hypothetical protein
MSDLLEWISALSDYMDANFRVQRNARKWLLDQRVLDLGHSFETVLAIFQSRAQDSFPLLSGCLHCLRDCLYATTAPKKATIEPLVLKYFSYEELGLFIPFLASPMSSLRSSASFIIRTIVTILELQIDAVLAALIDDTSYAPYGTKSLLRLFLRLTTGRESPVLRRVFVSILGILNSPFRDVDYSLRITATSVLSDILYMHRSLIGTTQQLEVVFDSLEVSLTRADSRLAYETLALVPQLLRIFPEFQAEAIRRGYELILGSLMSGSAELQVQAIYAWASSLLLVAGQLAVTPCDSTSDYLGETLHAVISRLFEIAESVSDVDDIVQFLDGTRRLFEAYDVMWRPGLLPWLRDEAAHFHTKPSPHQCVVLQAMLSLNEFPLNLEALVVDLFAPAFGITASSPWTLQHQANLSFVANLCRCDVPTSVIQVVFTYTTQVVRSLNPVVFSRHPDRFGWVVLICQFVTTHIPSRDSEATDLLSYVQSERPMDYSHGQWPTMLTSSGQPGSMQFAGIYLNPYSLINIDPIPKRVAMMENEDERTALQSLVAIQNGIQQQLLAQRRIVDTDPDRLWEWASSFFLICSDCSKAAVLSVLYSLVRQRQRVLRDIHGWMLDEFCCRKMHLWFVCLVIESRESFGNCARDIFQEEIQALRRNCHKWRAERDHVVADLIHFLYSRTAIMWGHVNLPGVIQFQDMIDYAEERLFAGDDSHLRLIMSLASRHDMQNKVASVSRVHAKLKLIQRTMAARTQSWKESWTTLDSFWERLKQRTPDQ